MCQRKRGPSYSLPVRKVYLSGTVIARRPIASIPGLRYIEVSRDVIFHEEAVFRKTQELSTKDEAPLLEFPDSEIQREEEEFEDPQIPDAPEDIESSPE